MKTVMRQAFEDVKITPANADSPLVKRVVRSANRADKEVAEWKSKKAASKGRAKTVGQVTPASRTTTDTPTASPAASMAEQRRRNRNRKSPASSPAIPLSLQSAA